MKKDQLLLISGSIFTAVSVLHLVRFFTGSEMIIFGFQFPLLISLFAAVLTAILAYLCFNPKK